MVVMHPVERQDLGRPVGDGLAHEALQADIKRCVPRVRVEEVEQAGLKHDRLSCMESGLLSIVWQKR